MALTLILLIEKWKEHEDKTNVILFLLLYTFKYIYELRSPGTGEMTFSKSRKQLMNMS